MERCCCNDAGKRCNHNGIFEIKENTRKDPDNYLYACTKHVGYMLGTTLGEPECNSWTVTFIGQR